MKQSRLSHKPDQKSKKTNLLARLLAKILWKEPADDAKQKLHKSSCRSQNTRDHAKLDSIQRLLAKKSEPLGTEGWLGLMAFGGFLLALYWAGVF